VDPDKTGDLPRARARRRGESRLVKAELSLLLADLAEIEQSGDPYDADSPAGPLSLVISRVARRAIAAGQLTEVELGRLVLDARP
jgi:hypothetical protein